MPPLPPALNREQVLHAVSTIQLGNSRAEVFAKLGKPVYSISMSDAGQYVERCRFRLGLENIASVEFRDGVVAKVDKLSP